MGATRIRLIAVFILLFVSSTLLAACSWWGSDDEKIELRMAWWGSQERHDKTLKVIELFEKKYPHIKISPEYTGDGYFDKLSTTIAGGGAPDIFQLGNNYPDYVNRGAVLDLTPYLGKQIKLDDFDQNTIDSGKMNGRLYGVNLGSNVSAFFYNKTLLEKHNIPLPPDEWTFAEFAEYHKNALEKLGDGFYGFADQSGYWAYFNNFIRQHGGAMYNESDGSTDITEKVVADWLTLWKGFRDAGLIPDAETSATFTGGVDNSLLVAGKMIGEVTWSNQFVGYSNAMEDELMMTLPPQDTDTPGLWVQPSQFMSGYADTEYPEEVAMFINFMVMDPEATAILGNDRGVPGSAAAREALQKEAGPIEQKIYAYFERAQAASGPMDREMPGVGEWELTLKNAAEKIAFGQSEISEVTATVAETAKTVIEKNTK